jgi:hypothetical protein
MLHKSVGAGRLNGSFVQAHGSHILSCNACELSLNQEVLMLEILGTMCCPYAHLFVIRFHSLHIAFLALRGGTLMQSRQNEGMVEIVFGNGYGTGDETQKILGHVDRFQGFIQFAQEKAGLGFQYCISAYRT